MITERFSAQDIQDLFPGLENLNDVFAAFEKRAQATGQVVCQFRVNGMNFSEQDERKAQEMVVRDVQHVEILVDTPMNLLASVIANWIEDLPRLVMRADQLADSIRTQGLQSHYSPFVRLIDDCQFLTDSLLSIRTFSVAADVVALPAWGENELSMARSVGESLDAFEKKDSNWLADVIEYDLANCLQNWHGLLGELHGKVSTSEGGIAGSESVVGSENSADGCGQAAHSPLLNEES